MPHLTCLYIYLVLPVTLEQWAKEFIATAAYAYAYTVWCCLIHSILAFATGYNYVGHITQETGYMCCC